MAKENRAKSSRFAPPPIVSGYRPSAQWPPEDDEKLVRERRQCSTWTWDAFAQQHFPDKSGNACRKHWERLMKRQHASSWDEDQLQRLAAEYMRLREDMWAPLADSVGASWQFVEAKCMEQGVSQLTSTARAAARRYSVAPGMDEDYSYEDHDSGIVVEGDETETHAARRLRTGARKSYGALDTPATTATPTTAGSRDTAVSSSFDVKGLRAPLIQEPPHRYQNHTPPQRLVDSHQESSPATTVKTSTSTRRGTASHGYSIASLLSTHP